MKIITQYSLNNPENYNLELNSSIEEILTKYNYLLSEFLLFIIENIQIKNDNFYKFIIQRGLQTVSNVFNLILFYSRNLDMAYYHSQKAFYFYVEFIGQISEDQHTFLQLSSRDAAMFVYKKTIFEINHEFKKTDFLSECNTEKNKKLEILEKIQSIEQVLINNIIENIHANVVDKQKIVKENLAKIEKIIYKIYASKMSALHMENVALFIDMINTNKDYIEKFYSDIEYFIKKYTVYCNNNSKSNQNLDKDVLKIRNKIINLNSNSHLNSEDNMINFEKCISNIFYVSRT